MSLYKIYAKNLRLVDGTLMATNTAVYTPWFYLEAINLSIVVVSFYKIYMSCHSAKLVQLSQIDWKLSKEIIYSDLQKSVKTFCDLIFRNIWRVRLHGFKPV